MYMDCIKTLAKNKKKPLYEQQEYTTRIEEWNLECAMLIIKKGKRETGGRELPNQERIRTPSKEENYKFSRILEATIKKRWKSKKGVLQKEKNFSKPNSIAEISSNE